MDGYGHTTSPGTRKLVFELLCLFFASVSMAGYDLADEAEGFDPFEIPFHKSHTRIYLLPSESWVTTR